MSRRDIDVSLRRVDPGDVGAEPGEGLAQDPAAAPDVQDAQTREGLRGSKVAGGSKVADTAVVVDPRGRS